MAKTDITNKVQRLEAFEERLGVRLEAISAFESVPDDDDDEVDISIRGELHSTNGTNITDHIDLQASFYDAEGRVIETSSDFIQADSFFGFHTFDLSCYLPAGACAKVRLVPKIIS